MSDASFGDSISDDLVRRFSSGDDSALEPLMKHHNPWLRSHIGSFIRNPPDRDDIIQIVWLKIFLNRSGLRTAEFRGYLRAIAANQCIDHIRRQIVIGKFVTAEPNREDGEAAAIEKKEGGLSGDISGFGQITADCLRRLPYELQEVIILYYLGGYKLREIGIQVRVSTTTAHNRLQEAIVTLRPCLGAKQREENG